MRDYRNVIRFKGISMTFRAAFTWSSSCPIPDLYGLYRNLIVIEYSVLYGSYPSGPILDFRPRPLYSAHPTLIPATSHGRTGIMIMFISTRSDWILDMRIEGLSCFPETELPASIHGTKLSIVPE